MDDVPRRQRTRGSDPAGPADILTGTETRRTRRVGLTVDARLSNAASSRSNFRDHCENSLAKVICRTVRASAREGGHLAMWAST
jgi:hypothetical protein